MKQRGVFEKLILYIVCAEGIVGSRIVEKDAVNPRNGQDNRIRGAFPFADSHAFLGVIFFQYIQDKLAKSVLSDFTGQPDVGSQFFHGQSGIRHRAPGVDVGSIHLQQFSWG